MSASARAEHGIVADIVDSERPFRVELSNGDVYTCDAFIAASGASARTLGVPGEDELMGYGVSTCATCDGAFFRGEDMLVVGGGDAAMEEATSSRSSLTPSTSRTAAKSSAPRTTGSTASAEGRRRRNRDHAQHRGAGNARLPRGRRRPRDPRTVDEGHPRRETRRRRDREFDFDVGAVFYAIGHTPNADYLEGTGVERDGDGYVKAKGGTGGGQTATDVDGIFAAGDVVDYHYQQAVTAAGMGCKAAIDADEYLEAQAEATAEAESKPPQKPTTSAPVTPF